MKSLTQPMAFALTTVLLVATTLWLGPTQLASAGPNDFNRLMRPPSQRNPPPPKDGIHDPAGIGAKSLQTPREAFAPLPKGKSGNYVDWVKALEGGKIAPRFDRLDPKAKPIVMDLNIVRQVKGSMPDVVYPHKQHTQWLDCSNCHPAIFEPKKGANQISMASIILGEKCGVCHGKVAFPVSECRRCHSLAKGKGAKRSSQAQPPSKSGAKAPAAVSKRPPSRAPKPKAAPSGP